MVGGRSEAGKKPVNELMPFCAFFSSRQDRICAEDGLVLVHSIMYVSI